MKYRMEKPVEGTAGNIKYQCQIEWRNGKFVADEPVKSGGGDTGPDPFTLLLSSLVSCTLATMRMYIDRKQWDIPVIRVKANMFQQVKGEQLITTIDRDISFEGKVETEKKERLLEIASACPVSKLLEGEVKVRSFMYHDEDVEKKINYKGEEITVVWKPELCKHSGRCVTQLPGVFDLKTKPWVTIDGADKQAIIDQVNACPTGALSYFYNNTGQPAS